MQQPKKPKRGKTMNHYAFYLLAIAAGFSVGIIYGDVVRAFLLRKETAALAEVKTKFEQLTGELAGLKNQAAEGLSAAIKKL